MHKKPISEQEANWIEDIAWQHARWNFLLAPDKRSSYEAAQNKESK